MTYQIVKILKIIIVALNRKNLLTGKENNKINKAFVLLEESKERYSNSLSKLGSLFGKSAERSRKLAADLKQLDSKRKNIDSADK